MSKPLNWMLSGPTANKTVGRTLRNRLAATTILAVVPFLGYGRQAYAACSGATDITCSGNIPGAALSGPNLDVTTAPGFSVNPDGLSIIGLGNIRFTDTNASSITNTDGTGLLVVSEDNDGEIPGAVTITTNGTISGTHNGIGAYNQDEDGGDLTITVTGNVTAVDVDEPDPDPNPGNEHPDKAITNDGIHARNEGNALTITTGAGSNVSGEHNAIDARNYGIGDLTINSQGTLKSNEYDAVFARNRGSDLKVTVGAQSVIEGAGSGINAQNLGEDSLEITVHGNVSGNGFDGIRARSAKYIKYGIDDEGQSYVKETYFGGGVDLKITASEQSVIYGFHNGIDARNYGQGVLDIEANGYIRGERNDGIYARTEGEDGLSITTGAQSTVVGGGRGIGAINRGDGDLTIVANGWVGGYASEDGDGIYAKQSSDGGALSITTGVDSTVRGDDGIEAKNKGFDALTIKVEGTVTGDGSGFDDDGAGIRASNRNGASEDDEGYYQALTITTGAQSVVSGQSYGIIAKNEGRGAFTITVDGDVSGANADGIKAVNKGDGYALTIVTGSGSNVTGLGGDGINAKQKGYGDLTITVGGTVTGTAEDDYQTLTSNNNDHEDAYGINARNAGENNGEFASQTVITVESGGLVRGRDGGIKARSLNENDILITNYGVVGNLSGLPSAQAIRAYGGVTHIVNKGDLVGAVVLSAPDSDFDDKLDNDGVWSIAGSESHFGDGEDEVNNTGTLFAGDPANDDETYLVGLERFNNSGLVSLVDDQVGDVLVMDSDEVSRTLYTGNSGRLALDAALGPEGTADELFIRQGDTAGTTSIHVNVVSAGGANFEGIRVVRVGGDSNSEHFALDAPVNGGFFTWGLQVDDDQAAHPGEIWHELVTLTDENGNAIPGAGTYEFPAGLAAAQDVWLQTSASVLERQADLRSLLSNLGVTPVADYSEPVEPTPIGPANAPGFWFKGFGSYIDRDDEQNGVSLDRTQTSYGGMAGFDFGTQDVGDALLFGVFGGYIVSDLEFKTTNTDWNYEGPTVGAYVTYLDQSLFVDVTVKADFLDIDIDPEDLAIAADDADTDAFNLGGRIDTGYRFGQAVYIEPQATLAVVHTEIDDVDIFGGTVEFEDETSVRGRLGLRLGIDHTQEDNSVYSADVTASVWEDFTSGTDVNIVDTGVPDFGASDDPSSTYGDLALGLSVANPDGMSAFVRGNYLFAEDYEAVTGSAGVKISW